MANFGWFGDSEHRVFDYKPIYYNKEKDELKQKFGKVDGSMEKGNGEYVPGTYIRGSFPENHHAHRTAALRHRDDLHNQILFIAIITTIFPDIAHRKQ